MPKDSISFRVPTILWDAFKEQTNRVFISRAPFLDHMVNVELKKLREDLGGLKLSTRAKRYISGELKRNDCTSVNIEMRPETARALRDATAEHNLVRDAFMCRLILFLRSTKAFQKMLEIPRYAEERGLEGMPSSPLLAIEAVFDDPLFYVRHRLLSECGEGVYLVGLPPYLDWAACYLPDERVPTTGAFKKEKRATEKMLAMLEMGGKTSSTPKTSRSKK